MYMHDLSKYNMLIIKVFDENDTKQFINSIEDVHNNGLKIIVITESIVILKKMVTDVLNSLKYSDYKQKNVDRLRIIFPHLMINNH
jgi:hypothetical protein